MKRILESTAALVLAISAFSFWLCAGAYAANTADQPDTPILTGLPLGVIVVSLGMTVIGYGLNYLLPFLKTDPQKGVATAVYQAVGVTLFELATNSDFGFNEQTGVAFLTAMTTWAVAHGLLFKPTGWSTKLGAGRNASG